MSFKPYLDSPGDYGIVEDIAYTLYAMDCEGEFDTDVNLNITLSDGITPEDAINYLIKEFERGNGI